MHTFHIANAGKETHNFVIEGNGVSEKLGADLPRGDDTNLSIDLKAGTYTIYCPVDKHRYSPQLFASGVLLRVGVLATQPWSIGPRPNSPEQPARFVDRRSRLARFVFARVNSLTSRRSRGLPGQLARIDASS